MGYSSDGKSCQKERDTSRQWDPRRQFLRLGFSLGWRWLLNAVFCTSVGLSLWGYSTSRINPFTSIPLSENQKNMYNALNTGLILFTGLQLNGAMEHMSGVFKWHLLTFKPYTAKEFIRIMSCDKQLEVLALLWAPVYWKVTLYAFFWMLLRLGGQVALATLALNATLGIPLDVGSDQHRLGLGSATVTNFNPIMLFDGPVTNQTQLVAIYNLGITGAGLYSENREDGEYLAQPFVNNNTDGSFSHWSYPLQDETLDNTLTNAENGYIDSGRFVNTTANCSVIAPISVPMESEDPESETYVIPYQFDGVSANFTVPQNALNNTYFIASGIFDTPEVAAGADGDKRAANVMVYWSNGSTISTINNQMLFKCTSRVSTVWRTDEDGQPNGDYINAPNSNLTLPDLQARMLAGGIGEVEGQSYSYYEFYSLKDFDAPEDIAKWLSLFPAEALLAMEQYEESGATNATNVLIPEAGSIVQVEWQYIWIIFGLILGIHFLLVVFVLFKTRHVIVRQDDPLSNAIFLKMAVSNIPEGRMLTSDEIGKLLDSKLQYTWEEGNGEDGPVRYLKSTCDNWAENEQPNKRRKFSAGIYD